MILPHTLSLITTHTCTAACDHCCFSCSPQIKKSIPVTRLHSLIDEAKDIPSMKVVVFTGGECFLLGEQLNALISHAARNKFLTRCVTNGYWANSKEAACRRVNELKRSGLNEINFSTGDMHSAYVSPMSIVNGALACAEKGIYTVINIENFGGSNLARDFFTENELLKEHVVSQRIKVQSSTWIKSDGHADLNHSSNLSRFNPANKTSCSTVLNVLAVTPSQELVACCGLHLERISELHIGSVETVSLRDAIRTHKPDLIKIWLHLEGPEAILEWVKERLPSFNLPQNPVHPCETCLFLYSSPDALSVIKNHIKDKESELVSKYLASITTRLMSHVIHA